jgi:hypothetical protein
VTESAGPAATAVARAHVAAFNAAVAAGDYADFLRGFADEALVRFENVPGVGVLEFAGRAAYTAAYEQRPPDDQIDMTGPASCDGEQLVIPFAWRLDAAAGTIRLTRSGGLVTEMIVRFADPPAAT